MRLASTLLATVALAVTGKASASSFGLQQKAVLPSFKNENVVKEHPAVAAAVELRGGGWLPYTAEQIAIFYTCLYVGHGTIMQLKPNLMAKFYGAMEQEAGSLDDLLYTSAASSQVGTGVLIYLSTITKEVTERAVAWSFIPLLPNLVPLLHYCSTVNSSFEVGFLTVTALVVGSAVLAILAGSLDTTVQNTIGKILAYLSLLAGSHAAIFPVNCSKILGSSIEGMKRSIPLWRGRGVIMAMHGYLAAALLHGVDPFKALGNLMAGFVVMATYLGFVNDTRKNMDVTNRVAWAGWILSSFLCALGSFRIGTGGTAE